MQELFRMVYKVPSGKKIKELGPGKHLPELTKQEQERLVNLFEWIVITQKQQWSEWMKKVIAACLLVRRGNQPLHQVLGKMMGAAQVVEAAKSPQNDGSVASS
ncbi:hypothetical protein PsorP6_003807 [Peronosclerospora sorghi]|uniref:Uncharacterized protein n=1 Tax=Peronosclerospora sorghi TaxID=230839 RepID=A0ACC0VTE3_9STRA|nr:hypothetical protein PsorP6_003807 [Peronosclerospora sorghi]